MKRILLIRHGRQCSKLCNVDVELDKAGREQALLLGKRLVNTPVEKIYSSDLKRAIETAEIINENLHLVHEVIPDIQEIDFGGFTGKTDEQIRKQYGAFRKERSLHREDLPYPEGGECGEDVIRRVMPRLYELCEREENMIAVVTHGGVIRSVCAYVTGSEQKNKLKFGVDLENTSITELLYDPDGKRFFLERLNDYAHLEGRSRLLRSGWKTSLEKEDPV